MNSPTNNEHASHLSLGSCTEIWIPCPSHKRYVLGLAFANYLESKTGMPKAIMSDQQITNDVGVSYVYLFSVKKTIFNDYHMLFCEFGLIIDGSLKGIFTLHQIIAAMVRWSNSGEQLLEVHLHHFLYVDLDKVGQLLTATSDVPIRVYLHDYFLCCISYNLQKGTDYCGASKLGDTVCKDCPHYRESLRVESRIDRLLSPYMERITFIAPSDDVRRRFDSFHPDFGAVVDVVPHQKFVGHYLGNREPLSATGPVKLAFLGMPRHTKGWDTWVHVHDVLGSSRYKFYVFNSSDEDYEGMIHVHVAFDPEHPNAMVDALRHYGVSLAMLYTTCPETYSYTCMEAYSANAFILTNTLSGNVCDFVRKTGAGMVFDDESRLLDFLEDWNRMLQTVNAFRATSKAPETLVDNDQIALGLPVDGASLKSVQAPRELPFESVLVRVLNRWAL